MVLNANVVIDYADADRSIFALLAKHFGITGLPRPLLREVDQIQERECDQLGLHLIEAMVDQLTEASRERTALSFEDQLCMITARDHGAICVTNDKALRAKCVGIGVPIRWGLEMMLDLVAAKALTRRSARAIAVRIRENNRLHITEAILKRFEKKLDAL